MKTKQPLPEIKMLTKLQLKKGNKYIIFISECISQHTYERLFVALKRLGITPSDVVFANGIDGSKVRVVEIVEKVKRKPGTKGYHDVAEYYKEPSMPDPKDILNPPILNMENNYEKKFKK